MDSPNQTMELHDNYLMFIESFSSAACIGPENVATNPTDTTS